MHSLPTPLKLPSAMAHGVLADHVFQPASSTPRRTSAGFGGPIYDLWMD